MKQLIISGAKSRSHLVYLASYLRTIVGKDDAVTAFFLPLPPFLHADAVTLEDARAAFPDGLVIKEGLADWSAQDETTYICVGAPGIRVLRTLTKAMGRKVSSLRIVVVDEGIGSYGDMRAALAARLRQGEKLPVAALKAALGAGLRHVPAQRWATFVKKGEHWGLNAKVVAEFSRYASESEVRSNEAVILTQPFVDMKLTSEEAYLNYVSKLAAAAKENGLRPVVRPHPAERPGRYKDFAVMDDIGTADLDPQVLQAAVCMGGPSTALINVAAMGGVPVVWTSAPGLEFLDTDVSSAQQEIFSTFLGLPVPLDAVASALQERLVA